MSRVYAKLGVVPLCLLAACATSSHVDLKSGEPSDRPANAAEAFVAAWNTGNRASVLATFEPNRRNVINGSSEFESRFESWNAVDVSVPQQCNPRGAFWKTATVRFRPRNEEAGAFEEVVWLHRAADGWWMYAL